METKELNLEGRITVFKTLALSKIIHLSLVKIIPNATIDKFSKLQKDFTRNKMKPKIKNITLHNNFQDADLKMFILNKKLLIFNVHG